MKAKKKENERHVEAVVKALEIINCFENRNNLKIKDIVQLTGLNKSRVIRLCGTLSSMNFIVYNEIDKLFRLGPKFLILGKTYERNNDLMTLAKPILKKLSETTEETALLFVVEGLSRLCLAKETGTNPIHFSIQEGERRGLYLGASGKILIAYGSKKLKQQILKLISSDDNIAKEVNGLENFKNNLKEIEKSGYAISTGEAVSDASAISVPIFNHEKIICASLSIILPSYRLTDKKSKVLDALKKSAKTLSVSLGYLGDDAD
jgi:DNA-binding IclR family transcriptional regulator